MSTVELDLHGFHPDDICGSTMVEIVEQAWQTGAERLLLIHGHGRNRGLTPGFVNTNTGYFGLQIRHVLRHDTSLRSWIYHTTLNCEDMGVAWVRLKRNPSLSRSALDPDLVPDKVEL